MKADICYYFLKLKMTIQNMLRWIMRKIYVTNSVTIIDNGKYISVYWRYIIMYLMLLFKFSIVEKMFKWCCDNIDVDSDTIQIVKNIDYVDRYIIYENKDGKNAIQNVIKYIDSNKESISNISLPKNLILKCELVDETMCHKKKIDLKKIFSNYIAANVNSHTIGNIIRYNLLDKYDIMNQNNSYILVTMMKDKKIVQRRHCLKNLLDKKISDLYNDSFDIVI